MHRWILGAVISALLLVGSGARAAESGQPFAKVPPSHWAYASVQRLEEAGYFTGSPAGTFDGRQARTRYEFAVAAERLYRSLQPRGQAATEPGSLRGELVLVRRLILGEFATEVVGLGLDLTEIRRQLETLEQRLSRLAPKPAALRAPVAPLASPAPFGLQTRLQGSLASDLNASSFDVRPGVTASAGPARIGLQVSGADPLLSAPNLPLEDPNAGRNVRADLSLPVGRYLLSANYERLARGLDPYGLWGSSFGTSPARGLGLGVSGSLFGPVGFEVQGSRYLLDQDSERLLYFSGGLSYSLGGFSLGAGIERMRLLGLQGMLGDSSALFINAGRNLGPRTRLEFRYRDGGAGNVSGTAGFRLTF